jgi:histidinol dehydrogenase
MRRTDAMNLRLDVARLTTRDPDFARRFASLTAFEEAFDESVETTVAHILARVRQDGDAAVLDYTKQFDRWAPQTPADWRIPATELQAALAAIPPRDREALEFAAARIRRYHMHQHATGWEFIEDDGTRLGQQVTPLDRAGLYVPGGKAAYPSSVLMNALAAKVAGVPHVTMVVPTPDGVRNPHVLAAAAIAEVDEVLAIGGAQAVAALAFGTATITAVDKIVGPGNRYVAAAKRRVFGRVGIDMVAGPSEIFVIADGSVPPDWVAMDLFSQAEHDEIAQAILVSPDAAYLDAVAASLTRQLATMPRAAIIAASLNARGALIAVRDLAEAAELINRAAPEHLELAVADPDALLPHIRHAGAIFLGAHATESLGDYCAGPNHVLPTARTARFSSPLGVYDFQKRSSVIGVSPQGANKLGPVAATLARAEGLIAHARAAEMRVEATP